MATTLDPTSRRDPDRIGRAVAVITVGLAVVGLGALVLRPGSPAPVADVSALVPDVPRAHWDGLYIAQAAIAVLRPTLPVLLVATGAGRTLLRRCTAWMSGTTVGAALAAVNVLVAVDLVTLPIAWWGRLSREPGGTWLADWVVSHAQDWALIGLFAAGLLLAMHRWPVTWHWRAALAGLALAALVPLASDLDPFSDRLAPLPEGAVRTAVEEGAVTAGAEDVRIRVGAGAAASENGAYVTGLGPSRTIVLSAELLALPPEQVAFVAMHEFAHSEHLDVPRKVLATATGLVAGLLLLRSVLASRWGQEHVRSARAPDVRRMIVALVVASVVSTLAAPISNLATRRSEAAADWRALELTGDAASSIALQRYLVERGAADPGPPAWYQGWLATHPSVTYRVGLAVRYARSNGVDLQD